MMILIRSPYVCRFIYKIITFDAQNHSVKQSGQWLQQRGIWESWSQSTFSKSGDRTSDYWHLLRNTHGPCPSLLLTQGQQSRESEQYLRFWISMSLFYEGSVSWQVVSTKWQRSWTWAEPHAHICSQGPQKATGSNEKHVASEGSEHPHLLSGRQSNLVLMLSLTELSPSWIHTNSVPWGFPSAVCEGKGRYSHCEYALCWCPLLIVSSDFTYKAKF